MLPSILVCINPSARQAGLLSGTEFLYIHSFQIFAYDFLTFLSDHPNMTHPSMATSQALATIEPTQTQPLRRTSHTYVAPPLAPQGLPCIIIWQSIYKALRVGAKPYVSFGPGTLLRRPVKVRLSEWNKWNMDFTEKHSIKCKAELGSLCSHLTTEFTTLDTEWIKVTCLGP